MKTFTTYNKNEHIYICFRCILLSAGEKYEWCGVDTLYLAQLRELSSTPDAVIKKRKELNKGKLSMLYFNTLNIFDITMNYNFSNSE